MLTLSQLRSIPSVDDVLADALVTLAGLGFDTTSWQKGSWQQNLLRLYADGVVFTSQKVAQLSRIYFNDSSQDAALTSFAASHYQNTRVPAVRAKHAVTLTATATAGPYTIGVGELVVAEVSTGARRLFTNTTGGTLVSGGTLSLEVEAQDAGTGGNVGVGTITELVTSYAGVTVTNPDGGGGSSLIVAGVDEESDETLRARNASRWGELTWATPALGYLFFARQGSASVNRAKVDDGNPRGAGTVDVYIATSAGVAGAGDVSAVQTILDQRHSGSPDPEAVAATGTATAFSANIYVDASFFDASGVILAAKKAEIESALTNYINGLDIGGKILPPPDGNGQTGYILASEWQGAVTSVEGVENIGGAVPAGDTIVPDYDVPTVGSLAFAYIRVS